MAVEDNKNEEGQSLDVAGQVKVGDTGHSRRDLKLKPPKYFSFFARRKKMFGGILIVVIIIAAVLFAIFDMHVGQKVYAQAAGHKVYKKEFDDMKQGNSSITDKQVATVLADKYLTEAMAKEHHVSVSQADIDAANIANTVKLNHYGYQNLVNQVYFTKLTINNQGTYKGKLLVANFSRNIPFQSGLLAQQEAANPKIGNAAAMAADKQYALNFITNLYNQIKAKKITFDQAMQMEQSDPTVGEQAYPSLYHSQVFDGTLSTVGPLAAGSITSKINNIKPGQLTAPFVVRAQDSAYNPKSMTDSYYLVVQLDSKSGGTGNLTFQQELDQAKKQLGYKINV